MELQSNGIFAGLGNPHLEPTTLDMIEWGVNYRGERNECQQTIFPETPDLCGIELGIRATMAR